MWLEAGSGKIKLTGASVPVRGSQGPVSVQVRALGVLMSDVVDRPGAVRTGAGIALPVSAEWQGVASVNKTPYIRISRNDYADRAVAVMGEAAVAVLLSQLVAPTITAAVVLSPAPP